MGPPGAADGLTECLALGADRGVLVTDRALAGSDTLATSRALALALGREQPDLIICGRNSTDGETGQVGPEVAELMGLPHVSHVRRLDLSEDRRTAVVERITDEGFQTLGMRPARGHLRNRGSRAGAFPQPPADGGSSGQAGGRS